MNRLSRMLSAASLALGLAVAGVPAVAQQAPAAAPPLKQASPAAIAAAKGDSDDEKRRRHVRSCHCFLSAAFSFPLNGSNSDCHLSQITSISALFAIDLSVM